MKRFASLFLAMFLVMSTCLSCTAKELSLILNGKSEYAIVLPDEANATETRAAQTLQVYLRKIADVTLPIINESSFKQHKGIIIGNCMRTKTAGVKKAQDDGFSIVQQNDLLFIVGKSGQGTATGVYYFLEHFLGCRKYDAGPAIIPKLTNIVLPSFSDLHISPSFVYRQSFYPYSNDVEYLRWHGLQKFEDLWGLWGHSYFKLVPPSDYFATHPEYFALVNGQRRATQLCLSNSNVFNIVVDRLKSMMANNPDAIYWSISPNDEDGYCTCLDCKKIDLAEGSPSGSLINFVNKIAAVFPDKTFTTLAYGYSAKAPRNLKVADNVNVFVSTIDVSREQPIEQTPSANAFVQSLSAWNRAAKQIFIWDYATQFTNYLSPFPIQHVIAPNLNFFKKQKVTGIFEQGSGDTYSDMAELNSYIQAKLLWDTEADIPAIIKDFCKGYYGAAGPFVEQYLKERTDALLASKRKLDIYGAPITDIRGYLSPQNLNKFRAILSKAAAAIAHDSVLLARVERVQLSLDYVTLQQSRHFGLDQFGFLADNGGATYSIKPSFSTTVDNFMQQALAAGVHELSEAGLSPKQYHAEWQAVFDAKWKANPLRGAPVHLLYPFVEDFPAKGKATLTDGMLGFNDFSYNWLCFYGNDMVATIDAGKLIEVQSTSLRFLNDQRHWIFPPTIIIVELSSDGHNFKEWGRHDLPQLLEQQEVSVVPITLTGVKQKAQFIRVRAVCPNALPSWRSHATKKPMIACDEIFVNN